MSSFTDLLPAIERAHIATRLVIADKGCQLGASLLALDLGRAGEFAEYVHGHYLQAEETESRGVEHWWVEVDGVLLDPTRDQFPGEDALSESYAGRYVPQDREPASSMENEVYRQLQFSWERPKSKKVVERVVAEYHLDLVKLEELEPIVLGLGELKVVVPE